MQSQVDRTQWPAPDYRGIQRVVLALASIGILGGELYRAYWQHMALVRLAKFRASVLYQGEFHSFPWLRRMLGERFFKKATVVFLTGNYVNRHTIRLLNWLPALAAVSLVDGRLDENDERSIASIKQLEILTLYETSIPKRFEARLGYALPECRMFRIENNWRQREKALTQIGTSS